MKVYVLSIYLEEGSYPVRVFSSLKSARRVETVDSYTRVGQFKKTVLGDWLSQTNDTSAVFVIVEVPLESEEK